MESVKNNPDSTMDADLKDKLEAVNDEHEAESSYIDEAEQKEEIKPEGEQQEEKKDLPVKSAEELLVEEFEELSGKNSKKKKMIRALILSGLVLFGFVILAILGLVFKLDTYIFPSSVFGVISDFSARPLEGVSVCMQGKCVVTDNNGLYSIEGVKYGTYDLVAEKEKYHKLTEAVEIKRGKNEVNRELQPFGFGEIKGQFSIEEGQEVSGLVLMIEDEEVPVESDGSFIIMDKMIGTYALTFTSEYYQDFKVDIELKEGLKDLGEIELVEARDISFTVTDWVNSAPLAGVVVKIGEKEQTSNDLGVTKFTDLALAEIYSYSAKKDGYNERQVNITTPVEPELIPMQELKMVRSGKVVYTSNRSGNYNVYASDYDGSNEKLLSDNKGENYSPELLTDGRTVMFFSTRDGFKDAYNQPIGMVYRVNTDGSGLTKITKNKYEDYGDVGAYNFQAQKRAFIKYISLPGETQYALYFGNIDGTGMNLIMEKSSWDGYISAPTISPDGKSLVIVRADYSLEPSVTYLTYVNPSNGDTRDLFALNDYSYWSVNRFSSDSKKVLFKGPAKDDSMQDIYSISLFEDKVVRITNSNTDEISALFSGDNNSIYFYDYRDSKVDLFKRGADGSSEVKLTSSGKVEDVIQLSSGLIFYLEEGKLKVVDPASPQVSQLVSSNVSKMYGSGYWD